MPKIFTIGFSGKSPEAFLEVLDAARIRCVWDIRLWRVSKYVPYYSGENLATVLGDRYEYHPEFAPEFEMLTAFKDKKATWAYAEPIYKRLIAGRAPLAGRSPDELDRICLMCTEKTAHQCHRIHRITIPRHRNRAFMKNDFRPPETHILTFAISYLTMTVSI